MFKKSVVVTVSLNTRFKFLSDVFLDGPSEAYKLFHCIESIPKLCSVWYLFKIKWPKSNLNTWVDSFFFTHVPPPLKSVVGGIGAPNDLKDVNKHFKNF